MPPRPVSSFARSVLGLAAALACVSLGCNRSPSPSDGAHEAKGPLAASAITPATTPAGDAATAERAAPADGSAAAAEFAEAPSDATKTGSGLAWKVLVKAEGGAHPGGLDRVTVRYTGWTRDGKVTESSPKGGQPTSFWMSGLIRGWVEGLQLMVKNEKRRFWIPSHLAYGDRPDDPRNPAGPLVFDIELLDLMPWPKTPQVPPDVAAVPKDAKRTASGLAYKVLEHGRGKAHPKLESAVDVHYAAWRTDGRMFDDSYRHDKPATFKVTAVNPGLREGFQLMVEGDRMRFWIPGRLIYPNRAAPLDKASRLFVFEVELVSIQ